MSDKPLRSRVKLFGNLLGSVLRAQAGGRVFVAVEALRKGYIRQRQAEDPRKRAQLSRLIHKLEPTTLTHVVRAFSTYFSLVNIAEESFQHRERRKQAHAGGPLWVGSFDATLREFHDQGISAQQLQTLLNQMSYIPVITAHPTESRRRTIMEGLRRIFLTSQQLDVARLNKNDRAQVIQQLEDQIQILWKTDEVRIHRPKVTDEIKNGIFYFQESLFQAIPATYRYLEKAINRIYIDDHNTKSPITVPSFLHFGSWIGGDRDGNPNVKPETTELALRLQTRTVLLEYLGRVTRLSHVLTQSNLLCQPSTAFSASLERDERYCEGAFRDNSTRFENEPYRRKLYIMRYRLERNLIAVKRRLEGREMEVRRDGYASELELLTDLYLIRDSLRSHGDGNIADGELKDLIRLAETFGFFLLRLDLRQESSRHSEAVAELITQGNDRVDYLSLSEESRLQLLAETISGQQVLTLNPSSYSDATRETLEVFRVMTRMRREISPRAFGHYVISMTHAASHVMEVMFLAFQAGLLGQGKDGWFCDIHITPLFETIEDLENIDVVMTKLLDDPVYTTLLKASGNHQEVMLGYSDSCKDGGMLASSWHLYEAQKRVIAICQARNVHCHLFHGRGGTIGRGGGPTHEAIMSQPPGTVFGQIKFTEQGEVLWYKYGNAETAVYELTMGITGLMKATSRDMLQHYNDEHESYTQVIKQLVEAGEASYRELTDNTEGLLDYFYDATPVNEIGLLNIGSRPSHRKDSDRTKASIRAIPWVFGWAQSRHTLPAWFGFGSALENWCASSSQGLAIVQEMYREWAYFRVLLSNVQMALLKADMTIARDYMGLCKDQEKSQYIYQLIEEEYRRTVAQVLKVTENCALMEENTALALALSRRDPYLDPLNYIQITLLERFRDQKLEEAERTLWLDPLLRTINAIAAGMRNTG